jgi:hypothetical protein
LPLGADAKHDVKEKNHAKETNNITHTKEQHTQHITHNFIKQIKKE